MPIEFDYRISPNKKEEIAQNLIDIISRNAQITDDTRTFVSNWILTVRKEKNKDFYDVWDIVLKNYMSATRPVLFRSCNRRFNGKIVSFTGRLECARRFSKGKGFLIISDTREILEYEEPLYKPGQYKHTFYPLFRVLEIARDSGGCGFSEKILDEYIGEQEYIMRVDLENMHSFRWEKRSEEYLL